MIPEATRQELHNSRVGFHCVPCFSVPVTPLKQMRPGAHHSNGAVLRPAGDRPHGHGFGARDLTQHQRLCIKGRRWGAGEQRHKAMTAQILTRHGGPSSLCPDCNTSRDCTDGHFSAHGMPDGARVVSSSYGQRVERVPRDPQVPLPDALGGPGSRLSPVSIPQHGTGDSGAEHGFLRYSTRKSHAPPAN